MTRGHKVLLNAEFGLIQTMIQKCFISTGHFCCQMAKTQPSPHQCGSG
uniref:Uncharacterized protein n=1 Tax=Anguilla anguilla TaxID=7936 RepID=A0A0E9XMK4_ANGAN